MIKGVIFDLDGVLVTTDDLHFKAWKALAESLGIQNFTKEDNIRQRGVSRLASLEVVLEKTDCVFNQDEKEALAGQKNELYKASLKDIGPSDLLGGVKESLKVLQALGIKKAVGSASKNAPYILEKIQILGAFDAIACGLDTSKSKPDPEVFLIAAKKLGLKAEDCLVVEDSEAGIIAAKRGGMKAMAVGPAQGVEQADYAFEGLDDSRLNWEAIILD